MMTKSRRRRALENQIKLIAARLNRQNQRSNKFSKIRLIVFLVGSAIGISAYYLVAVALGWSLLGLTLVVFNVVAYFHRKVERSINQYKIWHDLKSTQLARMNLDWDKLPESSFEPDELHAFEKDLDITGKRSLHRLIDSTVSMDGSNLLKDWLLQAAPERKSILARQALVKELTPFARFRDKLFLAARLVSQDQLNGKRLLHFLKQQSYPSILDKVLLLSFVLAGVNITLFFLNYFGFIPGYWTGTLALYFVIYFMNQGHLDSMLDESVFIVEEFKKFRAILIFLERYKYGAHKKLAELCQPFWGEKNRPSASLRRLTLLGTAVGLRMNPLFRIVLNLAFPWDFAVAKILNRIKQNTERQFSEWLEVLTQLEALNALANFAYLNPESTFPEIVEPSRSQSAVLQATQLGHPLLHDSQRRSNDFTFKNLKEIALITGSNMSGKSTFLKTVGINLSLAYAGGPVLAENLRTGIFRLYTCIQVHDSVTDGFSFFYAEVKRLKHLLDELQREDNLPLFFLIDEIFKGTNNKERLIGSGAYIKALAGLNGLGAVSTHDLELTKLEDSVPGLTNYHFREDVVDGKMVFDYKMRPGPCPSTNALKIMKLEGLPVE